MQGGGFGGSQFRVVSRFKLATKFPERPAKLAPVAKLHRACTALHTTAFLGVSAKFTTQNTGASVKFPAVKFTTSDLAWHGIPPEPLCVFWGMAKVSALGSWSLRIPSFKSVHHLSIPQKKVCIPCSAVIPFHLHVCQGPCEFTGQHCPTLLSSNL